MLPFVGWPPRCVFRTVTGVPCPLCGMTTGVTALLHGDVGAAFAANPAAPVFVVAVAITLALRFAGRDGWRTAWTAIGARLLPMRWPALAGMWAFEVHRLSIRW
jgi:hypothetical protein